MSNTLLTLLEEQFIYDLPDRLGKCIKTEAYADAVRFYTGALPIFKVVFGEIALFYQVNPLANFLLHLTHRLFLLVIFSIGFYIMQ